MKSKGSISNLAVRVLTLIFALFVGFFIFCLPNETYSAVTALDSWTNIYTGAPGNSSGTINADTPTVSSGSNRLFLAAVCLELSNSWILSTMNVTLGGTALTTIGKTAAFAAEHCYMGYLKESQIPAGSNSLSVQYALSPGSYTVTGIHVKWASYSDVNQTIPVNDWSANNGSAASVTFGGTTPVDYIAEGLTLYVTANGGTPATMTPPSGFSQSNIETTNGHSSFIAATSNHGSNGNYATTTTVSFGGTTSTQSTIVVAALNPLATMVGNGTDPGIIILCPAPNGVATFIDAFTLQTSAGSDTVSEVKVSLSTGLSGKLSLIEITSNEDTDPTVFGHIDNPGSDTVTIPLDTNITADETLTQYRVRITPKSHVDMPVGYYTSLQGKVIEITSSNPKIYGDSGGGWVTIDNSGPVNPTISGIPGDEQIKLSWTNISGVSEYVLLKSTSQIMDAPVDGEQYDTETNNTIGASAVIYVGSGTSYTDSEVTNEENYYYKIFAKDSCGNYSTGATPPSPYYYTPGPVITASSSGTQVLTMNAGSTGNYIGAAFTFQQSSGTAGDITALTISETGDADADTELKNVEVYYESGVDLEHCVYDGSGETLITTTSFDTSDKIVLDTVNIPVSLSPNYTCVYVVFDVDQSALNNTKVGLQITSSADFTISGSATKDGTVSYPVALPGSTTINSGITNLVKVGSFQSGTGPAYTYTYITDVGFKPKAVIFFWTRQPSIGFSANESIGMGFATASPSMVNRSVAGACDDNVDPTNCGRRRSEIYSIMFLSVPGGNPNPTLSGAGYVSSFDPGGFTIYWSSAPAVNAYINYMAIGGDDNFDVNAGTIYPTTSTGNQSFNIGFQPDFVMFLASRAEGYEAIAAGMLFNTGFMTSTGQAAISVGGQDAVTDNTGHARSQQMTTNATIGVQAGGNQDWLASYYTPQVSDGFTLNFSDAPPSGTPIFYLALKGGMYKIGSFTQQTTTGTQDTTVGFQPVGLFMASVNRPTSTSPSIAAEGEISIGAASLSTEGQLDRGTIWGETRDVNMTSNNSDANMSIQTDKVIQLATGKGTDPPTIDAEADLDSFLTNGFRLNWTTVDATARQIVYWAIGSDVTTVGDGTDLTSGVAIGPAPDGSPATPRMLERFTLQTSAGTDTVTDVTVTLATGTSEGLSLVEITEDKDTDPTVYGSKSYPYLTDTLTIPLLNQYITATTTLTAYRIRITPKYHNDTPAMPTPRGLIYTVKGKVIGITSKNNKIYNDDNSGYSEYVAIDNESPLNPTNFSGTPGAGQIVLTWTNPIFCFDCSRLVLLRSTSPFTGAEIPVEGKQYSTTPPDNTIGASTVIYVKDTPLTTTFTDTGLIGGETYYYKIFVKDSNGNYSSDTTGTVRGAATGPYPVVTASSSGAQVDTMEAGDTDQYIGAAFTFQQSSGTAGNITALTISETGSAVTNTEIKNVKVYYENDVLSCASSAAGTPVSASFNGSEQIVLSSTIPLSVYPNFTCIYVVLDVDLLAEDGHTVDLQITSSNDFTLSSGLIKVLSSYPSPLALPDTTTLQDTTAPGDIIDLSEIPGDSKITFNWTNPSDADFKGVRISRALGILPPADCSTGMDVAGTPGNAGTYIDNTVANGTTYSYRLCTYDEVPNYSGGVTATETPPQIPILSYPAAPYDVDGKDPDTGDTTIDFTFKVIYTDFEGDPPESGYPKIYIGDNDGYAGYTMSPDTSVAEGDPLRDGDYTNGEQYVYGPIGLGAAQDLRFYFEAKAGSGRFTDVAVQLPPTGYSTGPSVYLMLSNNMVGVPKDLGPTGLSYSSVLGDDSGYSYCVFWNSTGLDTVNGFTGSWKYCISGDSGYIEKGKGYYIFAKSPNTYRLDEPADVRNVTADDHVDIALAVDTITHASVGGWTMISNPYNAIIPLEDVKVLRDENMNGTFEESEIYDFTVAVTNNWIGNSIYKWKGTVSGYIAGTLTGSPPASLEPWVGYFIYAVDTTPTSLRVYKPAP